MSSLPHPESASRPTMQCEQPGGRPMRRSPTARSRTGPDRRSGWGSWRREARPRRSPAVRRTTCRHRPRTRSSRSPSSPDRCTTARRPVNARGNVDRMPTPGADQVDEDRVPIRERRDRAIPSQRADPEHVRQRGRIARVRPGARRRVVAVSDRRDDEDAVAHGVLELPQPRPSRTCRRSGRSDRERRRG